MRRFGGMSGVEIFSEIVVPIISILTFLWAVASVFIVYVQNKKLASFEKKNYVSKAVFDKLFALFQTVYDLMFELYNDFQKNLYPKLDRTKTVTNKKEEIVKMMQQYQEETKARLNKFIKSIHTNRFMIEPEIYESLLDFEECVTELFVRYEDKIFDAEVDCKEDRRLTRDDHRRLEDQAMKLREYYENSETLIEEYIYELQVG